MKIIVNVCELHCPSVVTHNLDRSSDSHKQSESDSSVGESVSREDIGLWRLGRHSIAVKKVSIVLYRSCMVCEPEGSPSFRNPEHILIRRMYLK